MANIFYDNSATGANDGANKGDAFTSIVTAFTGRSDGDIMFCSHTSSEIASGAIAINNAANVTAISVDFSGSNPPVSADILPGCELGTTTGNYQIRGQVLFVGLDFTLSGTAALITLQPHQICFQDGTITLNDTSRINTNIGKFTFTGMTVTGAGTIGPAPGSLEWFNGTCDATISQSLTSLPVNFAFHAVDFSSITGTVVLDNRLDSMSRIMFYGCKFDSGATFRSGTLDYGAITARFASNNIYDVEIHRREGTILSETTIVKTGGASDGTTPISLKFITTTEAFPYHRGLSNAESIPIMFFAPTTGSQAFTVDILTDGVTLTDAEAWLDVIAPTSASAPLRVQSTTLPDRLATPTALPLSSATWTTTGISTPIKQTLSITVDIATPGWVEARIYLGKTSATMYADVKLFDSARQYQAGVAYVNEGEPLRASYELPQEIILEDPEILIFEGCE